MHEQTLHIINKEQVLDKYSLFFISCEKWKQIICSEIEETKTKKLQKSSHLALWFFMKLGPCLRNSVVSPKTGHPMVPGGSPFFLYFTSFHLNSAVQTHKTKITPTNTPKTTIAAPRSSTHFRKRAPSEMGCWSLQRSEVYIYISVYIGL